MRKKNVSIPTLYNITLVKSQSKFGNHPKWWCTLWTFGFFNINVLHERWVHVVSSVDDLKYVFVFLHKCVLHTTNRCEWNVWWDIWVFSAEGGRTRIIMLKWSCCSVGLMISTCLKFLWFYCIECRKRPITPPLRWWSY